jgi:excisionase family DNA binding protein
VKLLYTPAEAAEMLGISRSGMYNLLDRGELESVKLGALRRIPAVALASYLRRLRAEAAERTMA